MEFTGAGAAHFPSIQSLPVPLDGDDQHDNQKEGDGPEVGGDRGHPVSLQQNPAHNPQEMRQGENFADVLSPTGHPPEGKHVSGQEQGRQEKEERHLNGLQLVFGDGGKRNAHRQIRENEKQNQDQQVKFNFMIGRC